MKRCLWVVIGVCICLLTACSTPPVPSTTTASTTTTTIPTTTTTSTQAEPTTSISSSTSTTLITTTVSTTTKRQTTTLASTTKPTISPKAEMRGAWVSYIELNNLLVSCKTVAQAKTALNGIFDTCEEFGVNTIFFHVRANSDAYYRSSYFKASVVTQPLLDQGFDPLSYAVATAHARDMELHAWVNPYRISQDTTYRVNGVPTLQDSGKRQYYVPTSKATQQLILNGIRELINNYAIDGIQYDDYFYPRGVLNSSVASFEKADYTAFKASGGQLSVEDWRRAAVDSLIADTHTLTKAKGIVFGVSPASNADDTYAYLYGNPKKWMSTAGYVDYICPQIYSGFQNTTAAFDAVTDIWLSYPRHTSVKLYVGLAVYKIGQKNDPWAGEGKTEWLKNHDILKRSVQYLRSKKITGFSFYSYSYLQPDKVNGLSGTNNLKIAKQEIEELKTVL